MSIKVLIVDDSALIRSVLSAIINSQLDMHLVGAAPDAFVARDMVNQFSPDVITLDIEMPKMDGLSFLEKLMKARPTPVLMISTLTEQGADATIRALELGAVDYIAKPKIGIVDGMKVYEHLIIKKIKLAARAKVKKHTISITKNISSIALKSTEKIIAVGASTGGTEAIKEFLMPLPADCPGIVITQHMPPGFTTSFAKRLNTLCKITVIEAQGGERILPGNAYLAPGNIHLKVLKSGANYVVELNDSVRMSGHKPSVDVMFSSVAKTAGSNAVGVLLTGMGKDGATGLLEMKLAGGYTCAQSEDTCVVFGMPKEAIKLNAVDQVVALNNMAETVVNYLRTFNQVNRL
jgi:two-component system chemotaxis response regulator CheB